VNESLIPGTTEEGDPKADPRRDENAKHPLLIWTELDSGDVVSVRTLGNRGYVGTVEEKTKDGLIIWIRDELNERKLIHFRDCVSVVLIAPRSRR
jgi:hypothetical protein